MAVGANQRLARDAEPLQVDLVADSVAGPGKIDPVFFCGRLDEAVVVGIFKPRLKCVVVHIGDRAFRFDARHPQRFKLQIRHSARRVLRQSLVDFQADFASRLHFAAEKVGPDDFLSQSQSHFLRLFYCS